MKYNVNELIKKCAFIRIMCELGIFKQDTMPFAGVFIMNRGKFQIFCLLMPK